MDMPFSLSGFDEMSARRKGESKSDIWNKITYLFKMRAYKAQHEQEERNKSWADFFNLLNIVNASNDSIFDKTDMLPEAKWSRRLDNTRELAGAFMVPVALAGVAAANDAVCDQKDQPKPLTGAVGDPSDPSVKAANEEALEEPYLDIA